MEQPNPPYQNEAQTPTPGAVPPAAESPTNPQGVEPAMPDNDGQKNKKNRNLIIGLIVALVIAVGAIIGVVCYQQSSGDEETAYEILEGNDNPQDYEDYLAKFPNGAHALEVRQRLDKLNEMISRWNAIALSENVNDFINFKNTYPDAQYGRLCDIKIDSLDFVTAKRLGTDEAYQKYLTAHPDGRYASEASVAQGQLRDAEVTTEDRDQIMQLLTQFYEGFQEQNETVICSNIAAVMTRFLHTPNATKAKVVSMIKGMFNEHIQSCQFVVNRDIDITRVPGRNGAPDSYRATFTVDQHIQRDNEGKTFGSYKCQAEISDQLLITSLTMDEISQNN